MDTSEAQARPPWEDDQQPLSDAERVDQWRLAQLLDAGYPVELADQIASRHAIDLHQAVDLIAKGCTPQMAADILL